MAFGDSGELFGTHPVQVCHEWNTAIHVADHEARPAVRPLTRAEIQALFDHVDFARPSKRKGWLTLFRDATLFKVIYAYGCVVVRQRCSTSTTSPAAPHRSSSAGTGCATCAGARPPVAPSLDVGRY